jgi:predicted CopG family antitoxin
MIFYDVGLMSDWKTIIVREEIYRLIKRMSEVEHRSISNMVQECVLYYFGKKHSDLVVVE